MRGSTTLILSLLIAMSSFAQERLFGSYMDKASNVLVLRPDSTYEYSGVRYGRECWSVGTWRYYSDTLFLTLEPIYDSIIVDQEFKSKYKNLYSKFEQDGFHILSDDKKVDVVPVRDMYYSETEGKQFQTMQPSILVHHKGGFYELDKFGYRKNWEYLPYKRRLYNPYYKKVKPAPNTR